jgi:hypothetical protein
VLEPTNKETKEREQMAILFRQRLRSGYLVQELNIHNGNPNTLVQQVSVRIQTVLSMNLFLHS